MPRDSKFVGLLVVVIAAAIAARVTSALILGDRVVEMPGIADQISYDHLARRVLQGQGFSFASEWWPATRANEPTAHWSFLYTLFLSGVYAVSDGHPLAARLVQAVAVGVLHPLLAWRISARLFGREVGALAAGLSSIYGYFVYYAAALMTESFFILAVLWTMDLATQLPLTGGEERATSAKVRPRSVPIVLWVLVGSAMGIAVLLRQVFLLAVLPMFAWIVWAVVWRRPRAERAEFGARLRSAAGGLLVCAAVLSALIAPWTVRNYLVFHRFVLLNTNAGYAFFWANHPTYGGKFVSVLAPETYQRLIPAELRVLNEAALDQALLRQGIRFVAADPGRYVRLSMSRVSDYFAFWPSAGSAPLSNIVRMGAFGICLPFMVYGLALVGLRRSQFVAAGQSPGVVLLGLFAVVYSLIHLLSWSLTRYRLPVDAVLLPFAAVGIRDLSRRLSHVIPHVWKVDVVTSR